MRKTVFKIIVSIIMILISWVVIRWILPADETIEVGDITILIYDQDEVLLYEGIHSFEEGMFLYDVLYDSFDLICGNQNYESDPTCSYQFTGFAYQGKVILGISNDDFSVLSNWTDTFLAIEYLEQNNYVLAQKGPSQIALNDKDVFKITLRDVSN